MLILSRRASSNPTETVFFSLSRHKVIKLSLSKPSAAEHRAPSVTACEISPSQPGDTELSLLHNLRQLRFLSPGLETSYSLRITSGVAQLPSSHSGAATELHQSEREAAKLPQFFILEPCLTTMS